MQRLINESATSTTVSELCAEYRANNAISKDEYDYYRVKRGLRNADGTGVMAGVTQIGNVMGYYVQDGERIPAPGKLVYRGIDVEELINGFVSEGRFGFEETAYLLLFGALPTRAQLTAFEGLLSAHRALPPMFTEDMILKAPSPDVMNKLARSVLALYSYDGRPDDMSLPNQLRQAVELIARVPVIVAHAFAAKRHYYDNESLYLHRPQEGLSVAQNFLYSVRHDNRYTDEEARLLESAQAEPLSRGTVMALLGVSKTAAYTRLHRMTEQGRLVRIGGKYYLPENVVPPERHLETIRAYLSQAGFAYRQDIVDLLRIKPKQCTLLLRRLVDAGELLQRGQKYLLPEERREQAGEIGTG